MEERQIIIACQNGQSDYYHPLVKLYEAPLYRFCYHLTGNEQAAKDLFQETWLKVLKKISLYQLNYNFKNWLFTIASNTYKDQYRKWKKQKKFFTDYATDEDTIVSQWVEADTVEAQVLSHEQNVLLRREVNKLKHHYKMVIVLHYFEGLSQKEVAKILAIPEGTVKSRLNQSKKIFRKAMEVEYVKETREVR